MSAISHPESDKWVVCIREANLPERLVNVKVLVGFVVGCNRRLGKIFRDATAFRKPLFSLQTLLRCLPGYVR